MVELSAAETERQRRDLDRRAGLRRMRTLATGLLLLTLAVFAACWKFAGGYPAVAYLRAFAEAALVGACADWFAVVALFRHPLGLPIPHTAILPHNKQRIADALGGFFVRHFFNAAEIGARLDRVDVAGWLAAWLREPENGRLVVAWSRELLPPALELLGAAQLRGSGREIIKNGIDSIAAAPLLGRLLAVLLAQGQHRLAFDYGLEAAVDFIAKNRATLRRSVSERASPWLPGWVDAKLADTLLDGVVDTLAAARSAGHPWRRDYERFLDSWVMRLAEDPAVFEQCERIKAQVLDARLVDDYLAWLAAEAEAKLKLELSGENPAAATAAERILTTVGEAIGNNESVKEAINRSARRLVMSAVLPHRGEIGGYVADVVAHWDNKTLVERLELAVGKDLQYIRINGTVVGGCVGLVLYTISRLLD
jgi:uncharacterized membrane-anchored protein YjiN (DUF445 family)